MMKANPGTGLKGITIAMKPVDDGVGYQSAATYKNAVMHVHTQQGTTTGKL
jgi:hypothetical protein